MKINENHEREIAQIYAAINKSEDDISRLGENGKSDGHPVAKHLNRWGVLFPIAVFSTYSLAVLITGAPSEYLKIAALLLLLVLYITIPTIQLLALYKNRSSIRIFFRNPNLMLLEDLSKSGKYDIEFLQALNGKSELALKTTRNRLECQQNAIERRLSVLVGPLEKIGIFPGLITLYLAASSKDHASVFFILAIVTFALYVFAFLVHTAIPKLSLYVKLIDEYLALSE